MDPIAVDAPAKAPAKPEPKPEPAKAAKPPFAAAASTATPAPAAPGKSMRRNAMVLAAAACSLIAGIAAVQMMSPTKPKTTAQPTAKEKPKVEAAKAVPTSRELPPTHVVPSPVLTHVGVSLPAPPVLPSPEAFTTTTPLAPPALGPESGNGLPVNPAFVPSAPAAPTSPSTPAIPVIPPTPPSTPVVPLPQPTTIPLPPPREEIVPGSSKAEPGTTIPPIPLRDVVAPASANEPKPMVPAAPPVVLPTPPAVELPGLPAPMVIPAVPPPSVAPVIAPPEVIVPMTPRAAVPLPSLPEAPKIAPPAPLPAVPTTSTEPKPLSLQYTKPMGTPEVKPVVATDRAAQTSFDVDLYEPKPADTYATISKNFYSDAKYAAALQEYNGRKAVQSLSRLDVPPIHVLKQRYSQLIGTAPTAAPVAKTGDGWTPVSATTPRPLQRTFTVPTGGLTLSIIAKDTLGSESRWKDIYDMNPQLSPGDLLPAGTVVKIPTK